MTTGLADDQLKGLASLSAGNPRVQNTLIRIASRQAKSADLHRRAYGRVVHGPTTSPFMSVLLPVAVVQAQGAKIVDVDGHRYTDCHMAYTASILGHNPASVEEAVRAELGRGLGAGLFFEEAVQLGELIAEMIPGVERSAVFHSGGETIAAAVRLARAATRRTRVGKFQGCYHGASEVGLVSTAQMLAGRLPTGSEASIAKFSTAGLVAEHANEFTILPFLDAEALAVLDAQASQFACVVIDALPTFASDRVQQAGRFVKDVIAICHKHGTLVVLDEVVTGFRLARGGAVEAFDLQPDLICLGKITSGLGIPASILAGRAKYMDRLRSDGFPDDFIGGKVWVSSTHGGSFLQVLASLHQLRAVQRSFDAIALTLDSNFAALRTGIDDVMRRHNSRLSLTGHPRTSAAVSFPSEPIGATPDPTRDPASDVRFLRLLGLYLRLEGVYCKTLPSMNLSAAHTADDVRKIIEALASAVNRLATDGVEASAHSQRLGR